jgi:hypothetical protein
MKSNTTKLGEFRTYTGQTIDVFNPDPATINIQDIAHSLSMQCRFGGHTKVFYSVAEHSIAVMQRMKNRDLKLTALLHDAAEAYLLDFPRPVKNRITGYHELEENLMQMIAEKFDLMYPFPQEVKDADEAELIMEWTHFMVGNNETPINSQPPAKIKKRFLGIYNLLTGKNI